LIGNEGTPGFLSTLEVTRSKSRAEPLGLYVPFALAEPPVEGCRAPCFGCKRQHCDIDHSQIIYFVTAITSLARVVHDNRDIGNAGAW